MGKWREAFEAGLAEEERAAKYQYIFGLESFAEFRGGEVVMVSGTRCFV